MKTVYFNGKVYTGELPLCSAFAVENGRFIAVGTDEEVLLTHGESSDAGKVDLHGAFVCAGFNDSHMHLLNYAQFLDCANLMEHTRSLGELLDCMRRRLAEHPPREGAFLTGRGWNQDYFTDVKRMPSRYDLDKISTDVPIMITRACGHCCVVNSKALELCGIDRSSVSPDGGAIGTENGEPDGRLYDNAMELAFAALPVPDKAELKRLMRLACRALNEYGVTSVQSDDYCVFRSVSPELVNEAYRELEAEGELTVRVYEQCNFTEPTELEAFIKAGNRTGKGSELFKIGPVKLLGDGSLGSRTAHLSLPYIGTEECGFSLFTKEKLNELVSIANQNDMQLAVHAIGDACLENVLDAIEAALEAHPRRDHRHGIVHCQITTAEQLKRMARLGMHIYAQTIFLDYDNHIVEKLVPPELSKTSYCWRTLLELGCAVSNGSDCPVEPPDVMRGLECAVTRRSMDGIPFLVEQAFTLSEALRGFTEAGARASFEENIKGRLEKGMLADFTVLGSDPFETDPRSIHAIPILATFLGGRCVSGELR